MSESDRVLRNRPQIDYYESSESEEDNAPAEQLFHSASSFVRVALHQVQPVDDTPCVNVQLNLEVDTNTLFVPQPLKFSQNSQILQVQQPSTSASLGTVYGSILPVAAEKIGCIVEVLSNSPCEDIDSKALIDDLCKQISEFSFHPTLVEEACSEIKIEDMADVQLRKLIAELKTLMFQIDEIHESMEEIATVSYSQVRIMHEELKNARMNIVRVNSEVALTIDDAGKVNTYDDTVREMLRFSKEDLKNMKKRMSKWDDAQEQLDTEKQELVKQEKLAEAESKILAFQRSVKETQNMYMALENDYSLDNFDADLSRSKLLKCNTEKTGLSVQFDKMRDRVDKLSHLTDICFKQKEETLDKLMNLVSVIEKKKRLYEDKLYSELVNSDLTDDKLKIANSTKLNIGKFNGQLGTGDNFYTFKSKFVKAYKNHPKDQLADLLKGNHLEGNAKDVVGSLDNINDIWERLKNNFGNTEEMLMFHFSKINKLGVITRQKSIEAKKFYVQSLINSMQDVLDIAVEHDLEGFLHFGPQLGKVVALLDNQNQNGWYKTITEEDVERTKRWERMIKYLVAQLRILQTRASDAEPCDMHPSNMLKDDVKKKVNSSVHLAERTRCGLCEDSHPNANSGFLRCKKFLVMTAKKRCEHVKSKRNCLQCLDNKTKWNDPNHECDDKWICRDNSHERYAKKLHFFLCEHHTENEENKVLFEEFKTDLLKEAWQKRIFRERPGYIARESVYLKRHTQNVVHQDVNDGDVIDLSTEGTPVFILQPILINNKVFNVMFDSGCGTFVSRKSAIDQLPSKWIHNKVKGPLVINGVGGSQVTSQYGVYDVTFPICDGRRAKFSGLCLDVITGAMPKYPVREASKQVVESYISHGGQKTDLPSIPVLAGGDTDFLIGILYNYFQPRLIHMLPSGLGIYNSLFIGIDGTRGCVGGPSELFEMCEKQFMETNNYMEYRTFLANQLQLFRSGTKICLDYDMFGRPEKTTSCEDSINIHHNDTMFLHIAGKEQTLSQVDESSVHICNLAVVDEDKPEYEPVVLQLSKTKNNSNNNITQSQCTECRGCMGCKTIVLKLSNVKNIDADDSTIEYRCVKCRNCTDCKNGEYIEKVSRKEEFEQCLLDDSVTVDLERGESLATLPFIANPDEKLCSNRNVALKIYRQQLNKLQGNESVKQDVINSEKKLQEAGYVDYVDNLQPHEKEKLFNFSVTHWIPWRYIRNENSVTTDTRIVLDASSITNSGVAMNALLPKGINHLNSLREIFLRWRVHAVAIHTDARKMYNTVKLHPDFWRFQLYLWESTLDPSLPPVDKVIKTLIYGVRSSGNQAQIAMRRTAEMQKEKFPKGANAVINDTYADDIATGTTGQDKVDELINEITDVLAGGGFTLKGYTISGRPPLPSLTKDGVSISVYGGKWMPEEDMFKLGIGPVNFMQKNRGKKEGLNSNVPKKLTKRICASKTYEVFDLTGLVLPITSGFKLDLHDLHVLLYDWDDELPSAIRDLWVKNFAIMESLSELSWKRAVVPPNAKHLEIEVIGTGDASQKIACSACYVRFECKDGFYSCQLIFAKSKLVDKNMTVPRAELLAATLNVHTVEIVKRALKEHIGRIIYVLDSEIALHWIATPEAKPLKPWVRNNNIEISRFSDVSQWFHVESNGNPADIATRKGATLKDVNSDSEFHNGKPWMQKPLNELEGSVLKNVTDIKLKSLQITEAKKEYIKPESDLCYSAYHMLLPSYAGDRTEENAVYLCTELSNTIREVLEFSNYIIDPNRFYFTKVVRVFAVVIKVAHVWLSKVKSNTRRLERYHKNDPFDEHFVQVDQNSKPYIILSDSDIQQSKNYFFRKATEELKSFVHPKHYKKFASERDGILYFVGRVSNADISLAGDYTDKMIDLSSKSFVVPIIDSNTPLAYSIMNDVHWNDSDARHKGVESTVRIVMTIAYILNVRELARSFRKNCKRCRYILKKTVEVIMGPTSKHNLCVAPPFYITQVDICGTFTSYSTHNKRATKKVWILVFVCSTTGCTDARVMEDYDTRQFLDAYVRFSSNLGHPKKLLIDEGSQLISGCENMILNMSDVKAQLNREFGIEFDACPVGGHNYHGRVERKIRTIKDVMKRSMKGFRLSVLQWETLCCEIANTVNNAPVAIGNETGDLENLDIITPNRLKIARNNNRSPIGPLEVTSKIERLLQLRKDAYQAWWEAWLISVVPKLVPQPKWFKNDVNVQKGDIVLFNKSEGSLIGEYKYGMVEEVKASADGYIRSVVVKYKNSTENVFRTTNRAVRTLVVIHRVDEIDLIEEVGMSLPL